MRHTKHRFVPALVPGLILSGALCSALAPAGCKGKDQQQAASGAAQEGGAAEAGAGETGAAQDEGGDTQLPAVTTTHEPPKVESPADEVFPMVPNVLPHQEGEIFGHVLLPNASQFIKDVQGSVKIPTVSMILNEPMLRAQASAALGDRAGLAEHVKLDQPMGCAVLDYKKYEPAPLACAIGYEGGVMKLIEDLGEEGKQGADALGASDHAAVYDVDGQMLYFDSLGDTHVVVAPHTELFGKSKAYLEANVIGRAKDARGDMEAVVFVSEAMDHYKDELQPLLDTMEAANQQTMPTVGSDQLDKILEAWGDYNAKSSKRSIEMLRSFDQLSIHLGVEDFGVFFGGSLVPTPGSQLEADMVKSHVPRVDAALAGSAPDSTVALFAYGSNDAAWDTTQAKEAREILITTWATATGRDAEQAKQAIELFYEESKAIYGNQHIMFIADQEGALFGLGNVTTLEAGQSGRDKYRAWSERFTPAAVLGDVASQFVTWSFKFDHATVDGVPVDRWRIEPTAQAKKALETEAGLSKKDWKEINKTIGELAIIIDRAEMDGRVAYTWAPKAPDAFTKTVIGAQKGEGSLQGDEGLAKLLGHHPASTAVAGLDIKRFVGWLRGLPGLDDMVNMALPKEVELGQDLTDLFLVTETREDGVTAVELVISTVLIDQTVQYLMTAGAPAGPIAEPPAPPAQAK